jgi:hypothetical protein
MKILKIILACIGIIIVLFLIVSLFMPKTFDVQRSITIKAPAEKVFAEVNDFSNMDHWSPWKDYDPNAKATVEGMTDEPGYKYSWSSENKNVGNGSLTRITTDQNKSITNELYFADFKMKSTNYWNFENTDEGIKVTWGDKGELPFLFRFIGPMMEKGMTPDFEKGLNRMKEYCEAKSQVETLIKEPVSTAADTSAVALLLNNSITFLTVS